MYRSNELGIGTVPGTSSTWVLLIVMHQVSHQVLSIFWKNVILCHAIRPLRGLSTCSARRRRRSGSPASSEYRLTIIVFGHKARFACQVFLKHKVKLCNHQNFCDSTQLSCWVFWSLFSVVLGVYFGRTQTTKGSPSTHAMVFRRLNWVAVRYRLG